MTKKLYLNVKLSIHYITKIPLYYFYFEFIIFVSWHTDNMIYKSIPDYTVNVIFILFVVQNDKLIDCIQLIDNNNNLCIFFLLHINFYNTE